jgi:hypothetical protein
MSHVGVHLDRETFPNLDKSSFAMLATGLQARRAAVFVHGFGGHATTTWSRTKELIVGNDAWRDTDAYFVGYDSTTDAVGLSVAYISRFIRTICPVPPNSVFSTVVSPPETQPDRAQLVQRRGEVEFYLRGDVTRYESVDLIGHSLGGVVLRAAILDLLRKAIAAVGQENIASMPEMYAMPLTANLRLFAPAQGGVRLSGRKGAALRLLGFKQIVDVFHGRSPSFQELSPGSPLLAAIRDDTNHFADQYPTVSILRARVVWAHHDEVVSASPFRYDASYWLAGTTHTSVCKPTAEFLEPLTFATTGMLEGAGVL